MRKMKKWLLNYARNASKHIPVESAIMTKKLNAPRRLSSMTVSAQSPNLETSHQRKKKVEVRYDPERLSSPFVTAVLAACR